MSRYSQTKIHRLFEKVPVLDKKGEPTGSTTTRRRAQPLPATPPEARRFKDLPFPVIMSLGQRINLRKEHKRQWKAD